MTFDTSSSEAPQPVQNSTNAIISLIMGILGFTLLPMIGSIVAVICGMMAKKEIRNAQAGGSALGGEGMATAGLIMGWIGIGLGILACCLLAVLILIPALLIPFGINWNHSGLLFPLGIMI